MSLRRIWQQPIQAPVLNLPPGGDPAFPVNGDVWNTDDGLKTQAGGVTIGASAVLDTVAAALTAGTVYKRDGSGWDVLDGPSDGLPGLFGVCVSSESGPVSKVLVVGPWVRSGTPGARLFCGASGVITEVNPGDPDDETMGAPWVWQIGLQVNANLAVITQVPPYRPRNVSLCLDDGVTSLNLLMRESPV